MTIHIVLADDHHVIREGLRALLETQDDLEVVGEAANGRDAVKVVLATQPEVLITDIAMPDLDGIEACRLIRQQAPAVKILALSMHADTRFVQRMLAAGAAGYLLKDCAPEDLLTAVRAAAAPAADVAPV